MSPGQAITHYAPDRPCFLLAPQQLQLADAAAEWVTVLARRAVVLDVGGRLRGVEVRCGLGLGGYALVF